MSSQIAKSATRAMLMVTSAESPMFAQIFTSSPPHGFQYAQSLGRTGEAEPRNSSGREYYSRIFARESIAASGPSASTKAFLGDTTPGFHPAFSQAFANRFGLVSCFGKTVVVGELVEIADLHPVPAERADVANQMKKCYLLHNRLPQSIALKSDFLLMS